MIFGNPSLWGNEALFNSPKPKDPMAEELAVIDDDIGDKLISFDDRLPSGPGPNWTQARNDHSVPLAEDPPVPKDYLYYDHDMNAYVYDPEKQPQTITIDVYGDPEMTDAFAFKVYKQLPEYLPIPYNVPIGVDISVHHSGGDSAYEIGESAAEWIKWITGQFEGSVWASKEQITAIGCDIRHKANENGLIIKIIMA